MDALNYLRVYIGKLYRYDKKPKYYTSKTVVQLMDGYLRHKLCRPDFEVKTYLKEYCKECKSGKLENEKLQL